MNRCKEGNYRGGPWSDGSVPTYYIHVYRCMCEKIKAKQKNKETESGAVGTRKISR